ncbi:MAG: REP-associated tyrosine transposase [Marinibacterium sp.]
MPPYRRPRITGATVFFTVNLADRTSDLLVREVDALREAVRVTRKERPFDIAAWVVLPDHLHCIWSLPAGDRGLGTRWGAIKSRFTRSIREKYPLRPGFSPDCPTGFSPESPPCFSTYPPPCPTSFPVVPSGRYAGLKPGLRVNKREQPIWQRRFWEHHIRDRADFNAHLRYCWMNPVKHGLVERPEEWPYSSVHRDMRAGRFVRGMDLV